MTATGKDRTAEALDRLVDLGTPRFTGSEVAQRAGVDREVADRMWRALGFPDTDEHERAFTDQDVRALSIAAEGVERLDGERKDAAVELIVREARILSAYMASLAEVETEAIPALAALGLRNGMIADAFEHGLQHSDLEWLITYGFRRQLQAAMGRRHPGAPTEDDAAHPTLGVGFIDLVDFTGLSDRLDADELDPILAAFETVVFDTVTELNGRVVKLIGDEAMFICPTASDAARAALSVVSDCAAGDGPAARAGIAYGPLLRRNGDYFGRAVNLASRLVGTAPGGTVLVDSGIRDGVDAAPGLRVRGPATYDLKGLGPRRAWLVEPADVASEPAKELRND